MPVRLNTALCAANEAERSSHLEVRDEAVPFPHARRLVGVDLHPRLPVVVLLRRQRANEAARWKSDARLHEGQIKQPRSRVSEGPRTRPDEAAFAEHLHHLRDGGVVGNAGDVHARVVLQRRRLRT